MFLSKLFEIAKTHHLFFDHHLAFEFQRLYMIQVTQHKDQVYSKQEKDETYDYHSNLVLNNGILAGIQVGVGKRNHEDRDLQEAKLVEGLDLVEFRLYERLVSDEV